MRFLHRFFAPSSIAGVLLTLPFLQLAGSAQVTGGTVQGTISDPSGAVIKSAQVRLIGDSTGSERKTETTAAGFFTLPNLVPGKYRVLASSPGFAGVETPPLTVTVGSQQTVNLTLPLAGGSQTVRVASGVAGIDVTTSTLSAELSGEAIRELPLNGRDWTQLATLQPGVNTIRNQATVGSTGSSDATKATRGYGSQLSISGTRSNQNNYRLDGVSFNDYTNDAPGSVLGSQAGVDAIQEFSVLISNYSAEYGRTSGGVVNAITRSGTNAYHGSAYEFARNSALDARNYFDQSKVPFSRNQFGASFGGPVKKDRAFFFGNYEGTRQSRTVTQTSSVPSVNARQGLLTGGTVTVDAQAKRYLAFYPVPNGATSGDYGSYSGPTLQSGSQDFYTARYDQRLTSRDSLFATFVLDRSLITQPDQLNNEKFRGKNTHPFVALEETHTFSPTLVNTVRFGFSRYGVTTDTFDPINPAAGDLSYGVVPGRPAPSIRIPGIATFFGGLGGFPNFVFGWNSFQLYDDAFLTRGRHSIKLGLAFERMQSNNLFHFSDNGGFKFNSLAKFLTNQPKNFGGSILQPATPRGIRETLLAGYVQDDWRFRPTLTLNLGLRYETTTVPTEVNGKLATLRSMTAAQVHTGDPYFDNPTHSNVEPRVGLAWDPSRNGTFVIRAGAGLYDVLPLPYEFLILSSASAPFSTTITASGLPAGSFPKQAYTIALASYNPGSLQNQRVVFVDPHPKRSYVGQWNLSLEKQFARRVIATASYAGSRGIHLPFRTDDADIVVPARTPEGYVWPANGDRLNPNVGRIDRLAPDADAYYDALQLGTRVEAVRGLQLQASYTWGKSIDTGSSTIGGDQYTNSPSSLPVWFDPKTRRSVSDFNLKHNFVLSGIWSLPAPAHGPAAWLSGGWQIGTVLAASSGAPFSVLVGGDPLGLGNTDPYQYPNRVAGCGSPVRPGSLSYVNAGCFSAPAPGRLGNAGRNYLSGPGQFNTDLSFYKNNKVTERFSLQLRAELFNLTNHPNFAPPIDNNTLFNQDGSPVGLAGTLTSTQTPERQTQLGVRLTF